MVSGPNRIPIVEFLQAQANESLLHAQQAGELITGLDGHPSQKIAKIKESNRHSIQDILNESRESGRKRWVRQVSSLTAWTLTTPAQ